MNSQSLEKIILLYVHILGILEKVHDLLFHINQYLNQCGETPQIHILFLESVFTNNNTIHKTL